MKSFELLSKYIKYVLIFMLMFILWIFVVHEFLHFAACGLEGYLPVYNLESIQPSVSCIGIEKSTEILRFFYRMAPYIFEIFILLGFLLIKTEKIYIRLIPHVIFSDLFGNFFLSNILKRKNDFTQLAIHEPSLFWFSSPIIIAIVLIWVLGYKKDFRDFYNFIRLKGNK